MTYRVFGTREGLVGGTTANGHIITSNDRFVALPSRRALASNGGTEYQVRVCYSKTGKCTTTSVWDVGPWNTKDDYWNPSSIREMWKDLPQGKPEAQAAYIITNASGTNLATVYVNQQINGSRWYTLGTWSFPAGWNKVQLSRWTTSGFIVVADAIQVR